MAEREGFEPSVDGCLHSLSRRVPSASSDTSPCFSIKSYLFCFWRKGRDLNPRDTFKCLLDFESSGFSQTHPPFPMGFSTPQFFKKVFIIWLISSARTPPLTHSAGGSAFHPLQDCKGCLLHQTWGHGHRRPVS